MCLLYHNIPKNAIPFSRIAFLKEQGKGLKTLLERRQMINQIFYVGIIDFYINKIIVIIIAQGFYPPQVHYKYGNHNSRFRS